MRWIGLTGKLASGKDYLYEALLARDPSFVRVSFADSLRMEIEETLGLGYKIKKPYNELERRLQQWWGTDYRRAEDPDYWVKRTIERAYLEVAQGKTPVFTDVRFPNEAEAILAQGGFIVRVWATEATRRERNGGPLPDHESETAMDDYAASITINSDEPSESYQLGVNLVVFAARSEFCSLSLPENVQT